MWWGKEQALQCIGACEMEEEQALEIYGTYAFRHFVGESSEGKGEEMGRG
jgi:hypothetical protein